MDTEQIKFRIEKLKKQREQLVNSANAELKKLSEAIANAQQRHAEMLAKGSQDVANLTGRIEELESLITTQPGE